MVPWSSIVKQNIFSCTCKIGGSGEADQEWGVLQSLERLHPLLCSSGSPHCPDLCVPGAVQTTLLQLQQRRWRRGFHDWIDTDYSPLCHSYYPSSCLHSCINEWSLPVFTFLFTNDVCSVFLILWKKVDLKPHSWEPKDNVLKKVVHACMAKNCRIWNVGRGGECKYTASGHCKYRQPRISNDRWQCT